MNKKTQKTMFSSATDDWATPQWLFDELNAKYGPFELDACASQENAKCYYYYTKEDNALKKGWNHGQVPDRSEWPLQDCHQHFIKVWMNPPYGREIGKWVKKAYEESTKGCLVVALLPARTCTAWFHTYIYKNPDVDIQFIRGRVKFGNATCGAPFPSMVVVFRPPSASESTSTKAS